MLIKTDYASSQKYTCKIGMISLGCTKNLVDTEVILGLLKEKGHIITSNSREADIIIINTCSFIESAKKEAIETILEMAQLKQKGRCRILVVTGCLAQEYGKKLLTLIPEIDILIGTGEFRKIPYLINNFIKDPFQSSTCFLNETQFIYDHTYPRLRSTWPHLAYIKIAEGCNHHCSYCLIPKLRGRYRSRKAESILKEAESLIAEGVKEICLIAQDTTAFGMDRADGIRLPDLLQMLAGLTNIPWIRLLYTYPFSIDHCLIEVMARHNNIIPYLDIPLQHTHPKILKAMNRPLYTEKIEDLIHFARSAIPDITIRTTFMVGFPSENEDDFESMVSFIKKIQFERLGVFAYSRERNTIAYNLPDQIPKHIKEKRYQKIMEIQAEISKEKNQALKGKVKEVICDYPYPNQEGVMIGRTKGQAADIDGLTYIKGNGLKSGEICKVKIEDADEYDLKGYKV